VDAEVEPRDVAEIGEELHHQRLVQPELGAVRRRDRRRDALLPRGGERVAQRERRQEDQEGGGDDDQDGLRAAPQDEPAHQRSVMSTKVGFSQKSMLTLPNRAVLINRNCCRANIGITPRSSPMAIFSACLYRSMRAVASGVAAARATRSSKAGLL